MKLNIIIYLIILSLILSTSILFGNEKIQASAVPASAQIAVGQNIEIPVNIDISKLPEVLGSFTATLEWDPAVLKYEQHTGGATLGFENPVVNDMQVEKGKLRFANAYPYGADGVVNILNVQFKVLGEIGSSGSITLSFSAMAAARTFHDLLPFVEVSETNFDLTGKEEEIPTKFGVENYPNPFNPTTHIQFGLPQDAHVKIELFNVRGQKVATLIDDYKKAGYHSVDFDGSQMASGIYFYSIQAGTFKDVKKMILMK